jgi:hypothetical protein
MVWKHSTFPAKKFEVTVNVEKLLATIFQDVHVNILIDLMLYVVMVTAVASAMVLQCLKEVIEGWRPGLLTSDVLLLQILLGCTLLTPPLPCWTPGIGNVCPHPTYTPDLAPWIFTSFVL